MEDASTNSQDNDDVKFKCEECPKSFNRNFSLTLHRTVVHKNLKTLRCKESGKVYKLQYELNISKTNSSNLKPKDENTPDSSENKEIQCTHCHKTFGEKIDLKAHLDNVHKDQKHLKVTKANSNVCKKTFTSKRVLEVHVSTIHKGVRNFQCKTCPKIFG